MNKYYSVFVWLGMEIVYVWEPGLVYVLLCYVVVLCI